MATITPTTLQGVGIRTCVETTMTASDTFEYLPNTKQILIIRNPTGGSLTPNLDGADSVNAPFPGVGIVTTGSGYFPGSVAAGAARVIFLDQNAAYLQGVINVTGCTGCVAILLNN